MEKYAMKAWRPKSVKVTFAVVALPIRLMDDPLMDEQTSFQLEHLGADVADESEVVVHAT